MHGDAAMINRSILQAMESANEGMHAGHSAWANPGALKGQLQAVPGIQLPTM
jgi:hypothetical protein